MNLEVGDWSWKVLLTVAIFLCSFAQVMWWQLLDWWSAISCLANGSISFLGLTRGPVSEPFNLSHCNRCCIDFASAWSCENIKSDPCTWCYGCHLKKTKQKNIGLFSDCVLGALPTHVPQCCVWHLAVPNSANLLSRGIDLIASRWYDYVFSKKCVLNWFRYIIFFTSMPIGTKLYLNILYWIQLLDGCSS